jgi:hypothetical protein
MLLFLVDQRVLQRKVMNSPNILLIGYEVLTVRYGGSYLLEYKALYSAEG